MWEIIVWYVVGLICSGFVLDQLRREGRNIDVGDLILMLFVSILGFILLFLLIVVGAVFVVETVGEWFLKHVNTKTVIFKGKKKEY